MEKTAVLVERFSIKINEIKRWKLLTNEMNWCIIKNAEVSHKQSLELMFRLFDVLQ